MLSISRSESPTLHPHLIRVTVNLKSPYKMGISHGINVICCGKRPFRPPLQFLRRNRSGFVSENSSHGINISADIHRLSQRNGFIKQAIDLCLFNSLSIFLLFAFDLQFAFASILFQCCFASYAPLKFVDTAFAANDLGGGYDLRSDLLENCSSLPLPRLARTPVPHGRIRQG